jgi:hypothetical protein
VEEYSSNPAIKKPLEFRQTADKLASLAWQAAAGAERVDLRAGLTEQAKKIAKCHRLFGGIGCKNGHTYKLKAKFRCGGRYCPACAHIRQTKAYRRIMPKLLEYERQHPELRPALLTLTLKNSFDDLPAIVDRLTRCFRKLRQTGAYKAHVPAALGYIETTIGDDGSWHCHLHLIVFLAKYWPQAEISNLWHSITGDSFVVDIRAVDSLQSGFGELVKYLTKPSDIARWTPAMFAQIFRLKRRKLGNTYGDLRTLELESADDNTDEEVEGPDVGDDCPECGEVLLPATVTLEGICLDYSRRGRGGGNGRPLSTLHNKKQTPNLATARFRAEAALRPNARPMEEWQ